MAEVPVRAGPTLLTTANTSQTIYTAPGSTNATWAILRDLTIVNETVGLVVVTYGIGTTNTDAAGKRQLKSVTLQANSLPFTWGGFLPLFGGSPADLLYAVCDTVNGATITLGLVTGP